MDGNGEVEEGTYPMAKIFNSCDKEIVGLLPWYVEDTLSKEEKANVERHLSECAACRERVQQIQWIRDGLRQHSEELFPEHILPEKLVLYAEAPVELSQSEREEIEKHLRDCSSCREELKILEKVNQKVLPERASRPLSLPTISNLVEVFSRWLARPAFAYGLLLFLLVPSWLGLYYLQSKLNESYRPRIAESNYLLSSYDVRSSAGQRNIIKLSPQEDLFSISFNIPILDREGIRYDAYIRDAAGRIVWKSKDIKSLDEYGTFLLVCHRQFFPQGDYYLKIQEIDTQKDSTLQEFDFAFQIRLVP